MIGSMGHEFGRAPCVAIRWHNSIASNTSAGLKCTLASGDAAHLLFGQSSYAKMAMDSVAQ
jgi:hypothetical protein